jgi:hypothetical protein
MERKRKKQREHREDTGRAQKEKREGRGRDGFSCTFKLLDGRTQTVLVH